MFVGEVLLGKVGVPLAAFQTSGGIILFIFALNMIFGDSKPEEEIQLVKKTDSETAIFPLAIPSIAGPGAILAIVLLVESSKATLKVQIMTGLVMAVILLVNYLLMRLSNKIHKVIGNSGAIVISKVMGLIVASMGANNVLMGIKQFFKIS
jgi:multiple antibiotic resistance protein